MFFFGGGGIRYKKDSLENVGNRFNHTQPTGASSGVVWDFLASTGEDSWQQYTESGQHVTFLVGESVYCINENLLF